MNIDTKRLAKDRAYWDEVAPEGATHYDPEDMYVPWMMETASNWMFYWGRKKEWVGYVQRAMPTRIIARLVIRPDAPEEWVGTGWPPVGTECECWHQGVSDRKHWVKCDVIGPYGDYVICAPNGGGFYGFDANELRQVRTQAQREREEGVDFAARAYLSGRLESDPNLSGDQARKISAFFYDAGMLRRAEE